MRRALLNLHLAVALVLCLPLIALGLSGSVLVYQDEIDAALFPVPAHAVTTGPQHSIDEIVAAAHTGIAGRAGVRSYVAATGDGPAIVQFVPRGTAPAVEVSVDPRSLAVLRTRDPNVGPLRALHRLHETFMLGRPGRVFVSALGIAMIVLGCSGIVLWWPRLARGRSAFGIRRGARGFTLFRDVHATMGFWYLSIFLIVSITGTMIAIAPLLSAQARPSLAKARAISFGRAAAIATGGSSAMVASVRRNGTGPIVVVVVLDGAEIETSVDSIRGTVLAVNDPREATFLQRLGSWVRPLHSGQLGPVWKVLVCAAGLLPLLFSISGIAMWRKRRFE